MDVFFGQVLYTSAFFRESTRFVGIFSDKLEICRHFWDKHLVCRHLLWKYQLQITLCWDIRFKVNLGYLFIKMCCSYGLRKFPLKYFWVHAFFYSKRFTNNSSLLSCEELRGKYEHLRSNPPKINTHPLF